MYLEYYNLKEEPFRLTPDPRFLHLAEPHRIALKTILQGVLLRKGFIVLSGPVGAGKTTLLHAALQILSGHEATKSKIVSAFLVNPMLTRDEFLEALLDEFEIPCPSTSKVQRLAALHKMLLETQRRGATTIALIDEAHLLSPELLEEIRLLSNADTYQEKLIQIVLAGQPELTPLLARPEMRALQQRIASRCELRALSLPETRMYIAERLHAAGLVGASPFSASALEAIFRYSQAVPRVINLICDNAMEIGLRTHQKPIGPEVIEEASVALGLAASSSDSVQSIAPPTNERPQELQLAKSSVETLIDAMKQGRAIAQR
jgi:general secretion pathway protein A